MKINSSKAQISNAKNLKIAVILSRFNDSLGNELYENTLQTLKKQGVKAGNIKLIRVPGALELPLAAKLLAKQKKFHAIIALGVVIKGETPHFEHVCTQSQRGLMDVQLQTEIPVIFGVITANTVKQAKDRVEKSKLNKGKEFSESAIEMAALIKNLQG